MAGTLFIAIDYIWDRPVSLLVRSPGEKHAYDGFYALPPTGQDRPSSHDSRSSARELPSEFGYSLVCRPSHEGDQELTRPKGTPACLSGRAEEKFERR
ncbi:hypothetical protein GGTG_04082 [Gaeumannomyces tritici R3-111a-1]|uniref:Uncharacterized protein n=1 Tax=Gaeumannomyces tritici (strain R3-111a-1) TaxID=644352 RepID=J3NS35_GAET3|nr:hypothetical protein GGTG_04082 [Gaeumannomyces tritici R3-111a-1]EJT78991.1 hypothetical protein GGTG_04082 [Gaeumannomyces tritici R3-111a-1]